jgi:type I restriction enzyme S subunit
MTDIPSGWNRVTLNDLGNWVTGATPQSKDPLNFGHEVEFVTPSDIGYGGRLGVVERRISELGASRVRKLKAPSVNLVCIGTIGKVALANREVTTNQQINSLEPNESVVLPNFAMWLLASPKVQEALWQASSSTTVAILNKGNLCKIETSIPPLPEQHKIVEILEDHLSRLDASVALADAMEKQSAGLRRSLLQAAFTGQLTKEVASV